jgi:tetratricopeptide (TPR) repeat protein
VFLVAIVVRAIHVWQMRHTMFFSVLMGDSRGYDAWAQRIANGDWVGSEVFYQAPLYPYFLGLVYWLFGHDLMAVRIIQAVLGALGCVALAMAAMRLFSPRAGLIAGLMLALYPPAIFFDGLLQKSVLDVLFVCVALAIVAKVVREGDSQRRWLTLGVVLGALTLTRENALALVLVVVVWSLARAPLYMPALIAGLLLVLAPVAARNYVVGGAMYLTTSQFGSNLYIGNNPRADGSYVALREGRGSPEFERLDATELAEQGSGRTLTPSEVSAYWTAQAWTYVRSHPRAWLALQLHKARLLVSRTEMIDTESQASHAEYSAPLAILGTVWHFGVLLPLAPLGLMTTWSERRRLAPFYALALVYALSVIAFFVVARYRLPLVPWLMLFASAAFVSWPRPRAAAVATVALFAVLANWPTHTEARQLAITENNLGAALQENSRLDDAIARYRRALQFDATYQPALNNLGTALRAKGHVDEALQTYEAALAQGPTSNASLYLNRGNALMQQGRTAEAVASFRRAMATDAQSATARQALANALYDVGTDAIARGDFPAAESALREALTLRRDYAEAHNNLGIALASQGRLADAVREWEAALRIKPDFADARRNLALAQGR